MKREIMPAELIDGWLSSAQRIDSPNFDDRPATCSDGSPCQVDTLVIHAISLPPAGLDSSACDVPIEDFSGDYVEAFFQNRLNPNTHPYFAEIHTIQVSAHFYIRRDGLLKQFVSTAHRAWHAGESCFGTRDRVNDFSIGIELEGCDTLPFTDMQYDQLALLSKALIAAYPNIQAGNIVGHSEIAPARKTDPGPHFDWDFYLDSLALLT